MTDFQKTSPNSQICIEELYIHCHSVICKALIEINHTTLCFVPFVSSLPLFCSSVEVTY